MVTIYHNPRCGKSREALSLLQENENEIEIIKYLDDKPSVSKIKELLEKLNIEPLKLIRVNEKIWLSEYKSKTLTNQEIIEAMATHPILIERPIVIKGSKAIIGRPPSLVLDFLK
jgi:arsenate reductase (glutaredoxin)